MKFVIAGSRSITDFDLSPYISADIHAIVQKNPAENSAGNIFCF